VKQPKLFEEDVPRNARALRGVWLDPKNCPHLVWDKTETTWPDRYIVERNGHATKVDEPYTTLTWTCQNCGTIRGRA
jgi:hypothetical protein